MVSQHLFISLFDWCLTPCSRIFCLHNSIALSANENLASQTGIQRPNVSRIWKKKQTWRLLSVVFWICTTSVSSTWAWTLEKIQRWKMACGHSRLFDNTFSKQRLIGWPTDLHKRGAIEGMVAVRLALQWEETVQCPEYKARVHPQVSGRPFSCLSW